MNSVRPFLKLIRLFEGFSNKSYLDSAGKWTVGVGHLITKLDANLEQLDINYSDPTNITLTDEQVLDLLNLDLLDKLEETEPLLQNHTHLNQHQAVALMSLVFNIGVTQFKKSSIYSNLGKDDKKAADSFLLYKYVGKTIVPGLLKRRHVERLIFNTPTIDLDKFDLDDKMKREILSQLTLYKNFVIQGGNDEGL